MKLTIVESFGKIVLCAAKGSHHAFTRELADEKYALDYMAATTGNMLVANPDNAHCFEITKGIHAHFDVPSVISVTGAPCKATLDGEPIPAYCAVQVKADSELKIEISKGTTYLCVNGNADTAKRTLDVGDSISFADALDNLDNIALRAINRPERVGECVIRLLPLKGAASYSPHALELLYTTEFTVSENSRVCTRFEGVNVSENIEGEKISFLSVGSVRFSENGTPKIMMNDSESLSYNFPPASVITPDLPLVAQLSAGDKVRFSPCTIEAAQKLMSIRRREQKKMNAMMNPKSK